MSETKTDTLLSAASDFALAPLSETQRLAFSQLDDRSREELYPHTLERLKGFVNGAYWAQLEDRKTPTVLNKIKEK